MGVFVCVCGRRLKERAKNLGEGNSGKQGDHENLGFFAQSGSLITRGLGQTGITETILKVDSSGKVGAQKPRIWEDLVFTYPVPANAGGGLVPVGALQAGEGEILRLVCVGVVWGKCTWVDVGATRGNEKGRGGGGRCVRDMDEGTTME